MQVRRPDGTLTNLTADDCELMREGGDFAIVIDGQDLTVSMDPNYRNLKFRLKHKETKDANSSNQGVEHAAGHGMVEHVHSEV
jgi:hypothetical protein